MFNSQIYLEDLHCPFEVERGAKPPAPAGLPFCQTINLFISPQTIRLQKA
jgi:hypothetical protein